MPLRRRNLRPAHRSIGRDRALDFESLEGRIVLAAAIGYDRASRTVSIVGSEADDSAQVRQQGAKVIVSLQSAAGRSSRVLNVRHVSQITFSGLAGSDTFRNLTAIPSQADGGAGNDVLRGGRGVDRLMGADGNDRIYGGLGNDQLWGGHGDDELHGNTGNDTLQGEESNDWFDGGSGTDQLVGGDGLDVEADTRDRFADGDTDGDGYDNDHDYADILYEPPGNQPFYADDASVAPIIAAVDGQVRSFLSISAADTGLRVRVQASQFGDQVTGVWRYLTPDKIQVWGKWRYPSSDPSQVGLAVQWGYDGPIPGDAADYSNPANYFVSEESRLYGGFLNGPTMFIGWLPGAPADFSYTAPNEQATGFPAPVDALRVALGSLPNFTDDGDGFAADFAIAPGFPGVQPVLDVLRTINRVTRASRQQLSPRA